MIVVPHEVPKQKKKSVALKSELNVREKNELIDIILKYCAFGQQRYQLNEREMQKTIREQRKGDILLTCYLF